jgi:hypothetical protein
VEETLHYVLRVPYERVSSLTWYLGHLVSARGIQPIRSKVETITKAPVPQNLTELQSFLGIVQYYARFVPNLSSLLHPLYDRLNAGVKWTWDHECERAFNMCKEVLSSNTVLTHYDVSKPLILVELRRMFAAYGLPVELVSDNGPQLVSEEFEIFLKRNGVKHTLSPTYHPASNGLAERNVQTFKQMLKKSNANLPLKHRVSDLLFQFRNTPHSLTGVTPAELFLLRAP